MEMSRQDASDFVHGGDRASSNSEVWNTLNTKYSCIHKPNQHLPAAVASGDGRYLTSVWVFGNREGHEPEPPPTTSFAKLTVDQNTIDAQMVKEKIIAALKILSFREPRVFIQFWSPVVIGKRCLLTTLDQPFGLGMVDEGLYLYRVESEQRVFVVDGDYKEKELGPPGRVYQRKLPEWSFDALGLSTRQCEQDWAACYNIHGYIVLPVFEPRSGSCVGVLELITSSTYVDYAFEVQEISRALKEENLRSPNAFEDPSFCTQVGDERRQHELDEIFSALKMICDMQKLPLAQTWTWSKNSSFVASSGNLTQSCSSFNRNCIGKVCMSTAALPFHVRDLSMWGFHEASTERHLEKSQGVVGRSMSSHGSCFCKDVTELGEDEYPLIHFASMNGITGCLAIYLKSVEINREYVLELYLPPHGANETNVNSLMRTVKQQFKNATRVQLGITSSPQVIGSPFSCNLESPPLPEAILPRRSNAPLESEHLQAVVDIEQNDVDVTCSKKQMEVAYKEHTEDDNMENDPSNSAAAATSQSVVPYMKKGIQDFDIKQGRTRKRHSGISNDPSRKRKKTDKSISLDEIKKHYGKTVDEAAASLGVSRSTLKRICRSLGIPRWPYSKGPHETNSLLKSDQTDIVTHASEGSLTPVFQPSNEPSGTKNRTPSGTTNRTPDPATHIERSNSSTLALQQQEQTNMPETTIRGKPIGNISGNKVENVTIKAEYGDNLVKFPFSISDGLAKLNESVATRFHLGIGSFSLKYMDEEGDMILIACDSDLTGSLGASRQPNGKTVIKLLVQLVADGDF